MPCKKKKSPFSFKTLLRFSKPFSCSKLLLYLIYPESILAKELTGFCFKSCWVLKHGSLQISFEQDISFWLVKSWSWFPCTQLAGVCAFNRFPPSFSKPGGGPCEWPHMLLCILGDGIFQTIESKVSYWLSGTPLKLQSEGSPPGAVLPLTGHRTMSGDIAGYSSWKRGAVASRGLRPEMLLDISAYMG